MVVQGRMVVASVEEEPVMAVDIVERWVEDIVGMAAMAVMMTIVVMAVMVETTVEALQGFMLAMEDMVMDLGLVDPCMGVVVQVMVVAVMVLRVVTVQLRGMAEVKHLVVVVVLVVVLVLGMAVEDTVAVVEEDMMAVKDTVVVLDLIAEKDMGVLVVVAEVEGTIPTGSEFFYTSSTPVLLEHTSLQG